MLLWLFVGQVCIIILVLKRAARVLHYSAFIIIMVAGMSSVTLFRLIIPLLLDISIYQYGYPSYLYHENGDDQCLANNTVINADLINGSNTGITCSRNNSMSMDGIWRYEDNDTAVDCSDNTGPVHCVRDQPGSVTLYTQLTDPNIDLWLEGNYTCCIEGLCVSIRLYQEDIFEDLFDGKCCSLY